MDQVVHAPSAAVLHDSFANRGTAFTESERERMRIAGWLPPRVESLEEQAARVLANMRAKQTPIERHAYLASVQDDNETLFFRVIMDNLAETLPVIYTPTVGQACQEWSRRFARPRGLYLAPEHRGRLADILRSWPRRDVGMIVVTDGGRILGLGDLGANGMGIPIGKLALYVACAGIPPWRCLPVMLDVGTDTASVRDDAFYLGRRVPRLRGEAYDAFVEEFVVATQEVFPGAVMQFEDFNNASAFRLLERYRHRLCCFNDDIQGTGAMGLACLRAASRVTGRSLVEERILFVGAGEACLGVGRMVSAALAREGLSAEEARSRCLFVDSQGALVLSRKDLPSHKRDVAQDRAALADLAAIIEEFRPTVLLGASGCGGRFTQPVIEAMARQCERPAIFALSNPTSKSECTAEQAYMWSRGRAVFASGSPFDPVTIEGCMHAPGQANNSYVFPGVGLGLLVAGATRVTDDMFLAASDALSHEVTEEDLAVGRVLPPQIRMRAVAEAVAIRVASLAFDQGFATRCRPTDLGAAVRESIYRPVYAG